MSFFASMLAGAIGGGAQGYEKQMLLDRQEEEKRAAAEEKRQLALQLAAQRSEDKAADRDLKLALVGMRGGSGGSGSSSGGGGGGGGKDYFSATTPEQADAFIREVAARDNTGQGAAALAKFYGRPLQETVEEFDPVEAEKLSRRDYAESNPDKQAVKTVTRNVQYDAAKGADALNRLVAMASGKYKDYAEGEQTTYGTDMVTGAKNDKELRTAGAKIGAMDGKDRFGESGGTVFDKFLGGKGESTDVGKSQAAENYAQGREAGAKADRVNDRTDPETMRMRSDYTARERTLRTQLNANNVTKAEKVTIKAELDTLLDERKAFEEEVRARKPGAPAPKPGAAPAPDRLSKFKVIRD